MHIHNVLFYGEILKTIHLNHFDSDPRFPPFLLYVRENLEIWGHFCTEMFL